MLLLVSSTADYNHHSIADPFIQFCGLYYWLWIIYLPKRGGYEIVEEVEESADGVRNTRLARRYKTPYLEGEQQPLLVET